MSVADPRGPAIVCWDGSDGALRAVRQAARLLGTGHPALVLFAHVPTETARGMLPGGPRSDAGILGAVEAQEVVDAGVAAAGEAGLAATGLRIEADRRIAEIVVAEAEARDAPVIVMGQRRRSALGTLVLGSVGREVLDAFHRPVLVVGPPKA